MRLTWTKLAAAWSGPEPVRGSSTMFNVVLVEPEIPPNTGNVARLCLAADAHLHLVGPLGFSLDDRALRRAGLDYWPSVRKSVWESFAVFWSALADGATPGTAGPGRFHLLSTKGRRPYFAATYRPGDFLLFGRETRGLPESLLAAHPDHVLTIPMHPAARSLNLATAVAIVLFEACRQRWSAGAALPPGSASASAPGSADPPPGP